MSKFEIFLMISPFILTAWLFFIIFKVNKILKDEENDWKNN